MHSVLAPAPHLDPARRLKKTHTGSRCLPVFRFWPQVIGIYFISRMNMELIIYCRVCRPRQAILKFANRYPSTNQLPILLLKIIFN